MGSREAPALYLRILPQGRSKPDRVDVTESILSLRYEDVETAASKLTLVVDNFDLANFDNPVWRKGVELEMSWGYVGNMTPTRAAIVQEVKGFRQLNVVALAKSILMAKVAKTRKWTNVKRSDVVALVAQENGYDGDTLHVQDSEVVLPVIHQVRQTDAAFLKFLAHREGWQFHVDFDGLHFHERKTGQRPLRSFIYYLDPGRGDVLDISIENDVTAKPATVTTKGRDPLTKTDFEHTVTEANTPRTGLAPVVEVVDPVTGLTTQQAATGTAHIIPTSELTSESAKRQAQGHLKNSLLSTVKLTLDAEGDPRVLAKSIVEILGIRSLSGHYYVKGVVHDISEKGYTMKLTCLRDGRSQMHPPGKAATQPLNTKPPAPEDTLTPREVVDPVTGKTKTIYVDSHGREQGA